MPDVYGKDIEMNKNLISIAKLIGDDIQYPNGDEFFRPNIRYEDCIFEETAKSKNAVYPTVRSAIELLRLDEAHMHTKEWNPFGEFISEGDCVLIKPNLVQDRNNNPHGGVECLYTQPSVLAPIIDFALKALNGTGRIVIGDAPMQECQLDSLVRESGYDKLIEFYQEKGYAIELIDFRKDKSQFKLRINHRSLDESVKGITVNLGEESEFFGAGEAVEKRYRLVDYPATNLHAHHSGKKQEYCISEYVLKADVIISVPKPKTHKKAGVTASLKNLIGINCQKDYLPHHTFGSVAEGGDEYKNKNIVQHVRSKLYDRKYEFEKQKKYVKAQITWFGIAFCTTILRLSGIKYENGSWYGNHTISKTITDLNKIVLYADSHGKMQKSPQRKLFVICDMIISGEKNGPVAPNPKKCGMIIAGTNPIEIDKTITTLMGFDINKIPTLNQIACSSSNMLIGRDERATIVSNQESLNHITFEEIGKQDIIRFVPPDGWEGHIEKV